MATSYISNLGFASALPNIEDALKEASKPTPTIRKPHVSRATKTDASSIIAGKQPVIDEDSVIDRVGIANPHATAEYAKFGQREGAIGTNESGQLVRVLADGSHEVVDTLDSEVDQLPLPSNTRRGSDLNLDNLGEDEKAWIAEILAVNKKAAENIRKENETYPIVYTNDEGVFVKRYPDGTITPVPGVPRSKPRQHNGR